MPIENPYPPDSGNDPRQSDLAAASTLATRALRTPLPPWAAADARNLARTGSNAGLRTHNNDDLAVLLFHKAGQEHPGASRTLRHALTGAALRLLRRRDVLVRMRVIGGRPYSALPGHHSRWQARGVDGRFHRTDPLPPSPFIDDAVAEPLIAWEYEQDQELGRLSA